MRVGEPAGRGTRGRPRRAALVALAALALAGCGRLGGRDLTVIVISLDTTRPDHLTPYDASRATTPTLGRLAAEGTRFTGARSTAPWTLPAHMSLFTGLPPGLHDVNIDWQVLDRGRRTMGEIFSDAGYRTMGVFTGPYVHGRFGFKRGMDFYERGTLEPMIWDLPPGVMREQMRAREFYSHQEVTSGEVLQRSLYLLRNSTKRRNLMFLHFFDPHYDYLAPAPYLKRFTDPTYAGPISGKNITANPALVAEMPPADRAQLEALYDAELAWVDDALARLLAELDQQGRLDSTLIVVTSDHGEAFFEHGRFGHRRDLTDEVLRIPLLVWGPGLGVPAGRTVDEPVSLADVLPTLIDYAALPEEPGLDGRSLRPLIEGGRWIPRPVTAAFTFLPSDPVGYYELHESMIIDDLKLVRTVHVSWSPEHERDLAGEVLPGSEHWEVYDLAVDPGETRNLHGTDDERVVPLLEAFEAERARQRESLRAFRPQGHAAPETDLSYREMLQAQGYLHMPGSDGQ